MLDPDPAPHNMDPPPKPSNDFVQPKKLTKGNVSAKSRNIKKNDKKNSSKGAVIAKGIDEMDVGNEACGNVEESVEGIGEDLGLHSKAQGDDQERNDGGNSVGKVAAEESGGVMYGNDGSKNAEMGDMESSPTMSKVPVGANANDSVRSTKLFANVLQGMAENNSNKLSRIASRIGTPIIMDKITSSMCEREFGRANFARVLVEVDAVKGLPRCVEVCYKSLGRSMSLDVEYAWTPPLCSHYVGMLDRFDHGLQTDVQIFVDFDYAMGRSITVMGRSIARYEFMIQGCAGSSEAMMLHMEALSTTKAAYMTLTEAAKEAIWLKGLSIE
ncbi:hypothetical protein CTI12_AA215500 [Artemisia annua]|uniref:Zinc finger, CCHC-type n=1 Tax=Artemisia annua TaxID=35608 RepID=A0A2U1NQM6_ARTAN|nr:hypothetical protein CTI12_AA215500 [Artemisia annua]